MPEVVVLAGGRGTRLAPYTTILPKPLMPVGDMPVLEILLRRLVAAGLTDVHLAVGHLAELIEAYFADGARYGAHLRYWREETALGTAGPLGLIETTSDRVLVVNGDLLTTLDFGEILAAHERSGADATIGIHRREVPVEFGVVQLDGTSIVGFEEKPTLSYDVSMGIYVFERRVIELVTPGEHLEFPELLQRLLDAGRPVNAFVSDAFWLDIGRHEDYEFAVQHFDELRGDLLGSS
jgi:NDP-sugar pyrophosphorylase family protein